MLTPAPFVRAPWRRLPLAAALLTLLYLAACQPAPLELAHQPQAQRWAYADSLSAPFTIADSTRPHRISLRLSLTDDYPFRNLYIRLRLVPPPGARAQSATPELVLQDAFGNWNVERSWRGRYELTTVLNDSARFRPAGAWRLSVVQFTRLDTLPGVAAVSLSIAPH